MPDRDLNHAGGQLWRDYKQFTSERLPAPVGRLIRSRAFDRLMIGYAVYGVLIGALLILGLAVGPELLDPGAGSGAPSAPGG